MLLVAAAAFAADTIDIGVLKNSELKVVQKQLYTKESKIELGASIGAVMDGFTIAPALTLGGAYHTSDAFAIELQLGGGYGLETGFTTLLEGPAYGVAVEANRYLASGELDVQYTPIYAKMNFFGKRVVHYDVYGLIGAGVMLEQSVLPSADISVAPAIPVGIGARFWMGTGSFIRVEVKDQVCIETFPQEGAMGPIEKPTISLGYSGLLGGKK